MWFFKSKKQKRLKVAKRKQEEKERLIQEKQKCLEEMENVVKAIKSLEKIQENDERYDEAQDFLSILKISGKSTLMSFDHYDNQIKHLENQDCLKEYAMALRQESEGRDETSQKLVNEFLAEVKLAEKNNRDISDESWLPRLSEIFRIDHQNALKNLAMVLRKQRTQYDGNPGGRSRVGKADFENPGGRSRVGKADFEKLVTEFLTEVDLAEIENRDISGDWSSRFSETFVVEHDKSSEQK